ncbi:glycosyltransferase family 4 protein [Streptomyces minutiscleroticus]|uniref:glycosyltransferase family 4 protein n=1 Tax=Streptomyces minutiscleroticus TaxID=68238 RepID=UPI00332BF893
MKITFLIHTVYGVGGTIRTTLNLAAALSDRHDVTIVSMLRNRAQPKFRVDPRITVTPLVDIRRDSPDLEDPLSREPSRVFPDTDNQYKKYSRLTDRRAEEYLRACDADIVIGTRPGINVYLARFGPRRALRIAQEHLTHDIHPKKLNTVLARHYRDLDAVVTTTEADAAVYRSKMRMPGVRILAVPNSVPAPPGPPSDGSAKVVAAGGRLVRSKRFDLLIEAFGKVAAEYPDWTLRIYGAGNDHDRLRRLIEERGLTDRAALMGVVSPIEAEFAKASIVAVASDAESFGMTIVEAMRCGVPVVSTDCPLGPAEIIEDGVDGRLVPVRDPQALAAALIELIADDELRRRMGRAALAASRRFDPATVARAYETLFAELAATRWSRAWQRNRPRVRNRLRRLLRRVRPQRRRRTV